MCAKTIFKSHLVRCSCWHLQPRIEVPRLHVRELLDHSLPKFWPLFCSVLLSNLKLASKNILCFQTVRVSLCFRNRSPESFFYRNDWWPSVWRCSFHWNRCFLKDDLVSLVTGFLVLWFGMHKVSLGCASWGPFCSLLAHGLSWL